MHDYERQWSHASGHGVRHPLRLKMDVLSGWCGDACSAADFEAKLRAGLASEDIGTALLAEELTARWQRAQTRDAQSDEGAAAPEPPA